MQAALLKCSLRGIDDNRCRGSVRTVNVFGSKTFKDTHWPMTVRTFLNNRLVRCVEGGFGRLRKQKATELKQWSTFSVRQPSKVSDAWESFREYVLKKAT